MHSEINFFAYLSKIFVFSSFSPRFKVKKIDEINILNLDHAKRVAF